MKNLVLVLGLGLALMSCKKEPLEEVNSYKGNSYKGDLFKVEQFNGSMYSWYAHSTRSSEEYTIVGGKILDIKKDYIIVSIEKNQSIQLVVNQSSCCSCSTQKYFRVTRADSEGNVLPSEKEKLESESYYNKYSVRCDTYSKVFTND